MLGILLAAAAAAATSDYDKLIAFDTVPISDGVIAFMPKRTDTALVSGNSVTVFGDDGVLVVDSGHFPQATRSIIAAIKARTKKPVLWLVNSHWHGDHNHCNSLYREAFPGVHVVATEATRQKIGRPEIQDEPAEMRRQVERYGKLAEKKELKESTRAMLRDAVHELQIAAADIATAQSTLPDVTFEEKLTLHLGGRDALVLFLGRGNTAGDTLVYLPGAKVLMTGDLLVFPAPYAFGSFIGEWGPTLRKAMAIDAATIIPGHGPVMHDKSYLELVALAAEAVSARVKELAGKGLSLDEVRKQLDVKDVREKFAHGDKDRAERFDGFFLGPGVPRAYREAKEGPLQDED
jgi:glyoxylase-like metal-dependent hydrolase (beta-lactamase superfamily II)